MTSSVFFVLGVGIVVFASTNMDDIFLVSAFFADPHSATRSVVLGQIAGIGALVAASALAALAAIAVPEGGSRSWAWSRSRRAFERSGCCV
jgi:cadmium resistance protein CadD (predicted permease)